MKHSWRCLLLAGVCALLTYGTSHAQFPTQQRPGIFNLPSMGRPAQASITRTRSADVIQARRQDGLLSRMGNFIWTLGGLRHVPQSPVTMPLGRRTF